MCTVIGCFMQCLNYNNFARFTAGDKRNSKIINWIAKHSHSFAFVVHNVNYESERITVLIRFK